jgi:hypothetical protein
MKNEINKVEIIKGEEDGDYEFKANYCRGFLDEKKKYYGKEIVFKEGDAFTKIN